MYRSTKVSLLKNIFDAVGTTVIAVNNDNKIADVIVIAKSENNCPTSSPRKTTGKNIATVVAVEVSNAPQT